MSDEQAPPSVAVESPREPWVYHPYLLATFPTLSLLSSNVGEASTVEAIGPLCVSVGMVAILYWGGRLFVGNRHKLGAFLGPCIVLFFAYGVIVDTVRSVLHSHEMLTRWQVVFVLLLASVMGGCLVFLLMRTRRSCVPVTHVLNRIGLAAVLIAVGWTVYGHATLYAYASHAAWKPSALGPLGDADSKNDPDIYFIVLDSYARADALKFFFRYDNSAFLGELRKRGFYVADQGVSNYCYTILCLASTLNMNYLDSSLALPANQKQAEGLLSDMIHHSTVRRLLKQRGYTFVSFATGSSATEIYDADVYLRPRFVISEFSRTLLDQTPIRSILNRYPVIYELCRERIHFTLDQLESLRRSRGPMFVMAHVIAPHNPHVMDENGKLPVPQKGTWPLAPGQKHGGGLLDYVTGYRSAVTFLNKRVLEIIDAVRNRSPNAVFIIQGDHGSRIVGRDADFAIQVADKTHIFNAYGFPGVDANKVLWPSITPVNSFRVMFNCYFGAHFPMLDGYTYLTSSEELDKLVTLGPHKGHDDQTPGSQ